MSRKTFVYLMIAASAMAACGDDAAGPEPVAGEFELTVDGAVTETVEGPAYFGSDVNDDGEPVFLLILGQDTSRHLVMVAQAGASRPRPGTYEIEAPTAAADWTALHLITDEDELLGMFVAETGTLTITESTSAGIRGSLEFTGAGLWGLEDGELEVSGTFVAAPASSMSAATAAAGAWIR